MNTTLDPRIIEALEDEHLDPQTAVLENADIQEPGSRTPSVWTVRTPECTVFLWDLHNSGEISVYAKTTHDGRCYPVESCISCSGQFQQEELSK